MTSQQYLIIAENIIYKNNKLSCINIFDQFMSVKLPAEFIFDLAVVCGPGWTPGDHKVSIKAKTDQTEMADIGDIEVKIPHENFVYNAMAQNLKIAVGPGVKDVTFVVLKNDEQVIERTYAINTLLVPAPAESAQNAQEQPQAEVEA